MNDKQRLEEAGWEKVPNPAVLARFEWRHRVFGDQLFSTSIAIHRHDHAEIPFVLLPAETDGGNVGDTPMTLAKAARKNAELHASGDKRLWCPAAFEE